MGLWQDIEVRFDLNKKGLTPENGETIIEKIEPVEDTKGNNGDKAIGYGCFLSIDSRTVFSNLKGCTEALVILTKCCGTRFEFIFTHLSPNNSKLFMTVMMVYKAYDSSRLYRELKLRGALLEDKKLLLLPLEKLYEEVEGVWNLSADQGSLGKFFITNVRLVWSATTNENFNISIPYLQVLKIMNKNSKFGEALIVQMSKQAGDYLLGFRIDPQERFNSVMKQVTSFYQHYTLNPILGIEIVQLTDEVPEYKNPTDNNDWMTEDAEDHRDFFAAYLADQTKLTDREPIYNEELGLAVEQLPENYTITDLWNMFPPKDSDNKNTL